MTILDFETARAISSRRFYHNARLLYRLREDESENGAAEAMTEAAAMRARSRQSLLNDAEQDADDCGVLLLAALATHDNKLFANFVHRYVWKDWQFAKPFYWHVGAALRSMRACPEADVRLLLLVLSRSLLCMQVLCVQLELQGLVPSLITRPRWLRESSGATRFRGHVLVQDRLRHFAGAIRCCSYRSGSRRRERSRQPATAHCTSRASG